MIPAVFGSKQAESKPVAQSKQSKQPIIRKNGLMTNLVGGGIIGAIFAPKNINFELNSIIGKKEVRDEFITQVGEKIGDEQKTLFKKLLDDFDSGFKNIESSAKKLMSKALDIKPDELTDEAKVAGKRLKQAAVDLNVPDNIKVAINKLDDAAEFTRSGLISSNEMAGTLGDVSKKLMDAFKTNVKKTPVGILKSAALCAGAGVVISVLFDLIAASARNSKSQK